MSHALEIVDGKVSMAYAGAVPWHRLGTKVEDDVTIEEFIVAANLDWTVKKYAMQVAATGQTVPSHMALIRETDSKVLDVVTDENWKPVQNIEAFEFFRPMLETDKVKLHTAGSLHGGQVVWCLARVASDFELFNGDKVEGYLLFTNYHKYGMATDIRFTPVRVVCNNTIQMALSDDKRGNGSVKLSHRNEFDAEQARLMLGVVDEKMTTYKALAEFLGSRRFTDETVKQYLAKAFPLASTKKLVKRNDVELIKDVWHERVDGKLTPILSKNADLAYQILDKQPGAEFAPGTWWQAFNAVTFITDHQAGRDDETRLKSQWYGPNKTVKDRALEEVKTFAKAA